jgi:hypothetical protein
MHLLMILMMMMPILSFTATRDADEAGATLMAVEPAANRKAQVLGTWPACGNRPPHISR